MEHDEVQSLSYTQAARELETILAELESDRLDVDEVVARVQRAQALVAHCREKVSSAKAQVKSIVAELE